jgi:putative mRNA 3-end processing factor
MPADLLIPDEVGLSCSAGGFHIDPWGCAKIAVITHAHGDHARGGSGVYYCAREGADLLAARLPASAEIRALEWGEPVKFGPTKVTLHPAGHVRGSAQVRVEGAGHSSRKSGVWVASGDYKRAYDPTCSPFEVVACDTYITEATFGLPIYRWQPAASVAIEIADWWAHNKVMGRASVMFCYALGKAQRIMAELWALRTNPTYTWIANETLLLHGAMRALTSIYANAGVALPPFASVSEETKPGAGGESTAGRLAMAPPSAAGSPWMRRFGNNVSTGFGSGWMLVRGVRRRRGYDRGFVISDHIDWPDLLTTLKQTGAKRILVTHGYTGIVSRYLREIGYDSTPLETKYVGEEAAESIDAASKVDAEDHGGSIGDERRGQSVSIDVTRDQPSSAPERKQADAVIEEIDDN